MSGLGLLTVWWFCISILALAAVTVVLPTVWVTTKSLQWSRPAQAGTVAFAVLVYLPALAFGFMWFAEFWARAVAW